MLNAQETRPTDRMRLQPAAAPIVLQARKVRLLSMGREWAVYSLSGIRMAGPGTYSAMADMIARHGWERSQ